MPGTPIRLSLLHTNDMHASLEAMSRLSSVARRMQRELRGQGRHVFLFDAGDAADRRERFCSITKGQSFPPLLSAMGEHGYDLQALGNAISITYGPQAAAEMAVRASFPILAANFFRDVQALVPGFRPTAEFPLEYGLRLGVVGLTVHAPDVYRLFGLEIPDFIESTRQWLATLQERGRGPIVVLSHLGLNLDRQLAEAAPEIDLIIGGHTHSRLPEGELVNGVLIAQAGEYAQFLGRLDLEIDPSSGAVLHKSAALIEIPPDAPLDPAFEAALQEAQAEARRVMSRPVGELQETLNQNFFAECGIGDLAADAIRERMQAEACILNGGLFLKGLPAGEVTLLDLDDACFTTANPQLSLLRGEQIRQALEQALEPELMNTYLKAFRGAPMGMPAISGMTVSYDPEAAPGERVKSIFIQGQPLEEKRSYRLAHSDAEVRNEIFPEGLLDLEDGQTIKVEVPTILREAIEDYLQAHSPLPKPPGTRWRRST